MRFTLLALCASLIALPACKKSEPTVADYLATLKGEGTAVEKDKALERLRQAATAENGKELGDALKELPTKYRSSIAMTLGDLKAAAAVPGLIAAIDQKAVGGKGQGTQEANLANKEIARALGAIGSKEAVKPLIELLGNTKDDLVRIDTLDALGALKDKSAVETIAKVATDERLEPFVTKKALLALTELNDPAALDAFMRMLFAERRGISFYPEASFGVFSLGSVANDRILAVVEGKDQALLDWAKERKILLPAIYAKAAQIEADLQDPRAIPGLLKMLKYTDANMAYQLFVRLAAADSLGRMRAKEGVKPIAEMLAEMDPNARQAYVRSLVSIGDKGALPKLTACAKDGPWAAREPCMWGLAMIGTPKEGALFDGFIKGESARFTKECEEGFYGEVDCKGELEKNVTSRTATMNKYKTVIETVAPCADNACVAAALSHAENAVRERAGYELGHRGATDALPQLIGVIKQEVKDAPGLSPRFSAIWAVDVITSKAPEAKSAVRGEAAALRKQADDETKKVLMQKLAEELKRLAVKLERA